LAREGLVMNSDETAKKVYEEIKPGAVA